MIALRVTLLLALLTSACGSTSESSSDVGSPPTTTPTAPGEQAPSPVPSSSSPSASNPPAPAPGPASLPEMKVVTFNTGMHDLDKDDDFSGSKAKTIEDHYGSGLAWDPAITDAAAWLKTVDADIIGFQELFDPEECPNIPADKKAGLVCETWTPSDPTVAQRLVGAGYQVACHVGHHDNCIAVKLSFGKIAGCTGTLCRDGLTGTQVQGCGKGARVGRGVVELVSGAKLTVVSIHGSSGFDAETIDCRKKQFEQVFVSLDGAPAVNGTANLVLGDFNTDPARMTTIDASAKALAGFVGKGKKFDFITEVGMSAPPTYQQKVVPLLPAGVNIDLVASDVVKGTCFTPGVTPGRPAVGPGWFDHTPQVCTVKP